MGSPKATWTEWRTGAPKVAPRACPVGQVQAVRAGLAERAPADRAPAGPEVVSALGVARVVAPVVQGVGAEAVRLVDWGWSS